jgi:hypothetical protein
MMPIDSGSYPDGPHPEERALARVSKDGSLRGPRLWPSFETHRFRDAPQDEVASIDMAGTSETLYLRARHSWRLAPPPSDTLKRKRTGDRDDLPNLRGLSR